MDCFLGAYLVNPLVMQLLRIQPTAHVARKTKECIELECVTESELTMNCMHIVYDIVRVLSVLNLIVSGCVQDDVIVEGGIEAELSVYDMWHAVDL